MRSRVLIIAEQTALRAAVARVLVPIGYLVEVASNKKTARELLIKEKFKSAIVAYDSSLELDIALLREVQDQVGNLIVLVEDETAGGQIAALVPGARLCLSEPLEPLRIVALLGDGASRDHVLHDFSIASNVLHFAGCKLDIPSHSFYGPTGLEVPLTHREFSLLVAFVQNRGRVLSRRELGDAIDGRGVSAYDRSIDMLVARLRRKIKIHATNAHIITTVLGAGYKFVASIVTWSAEP